MVVDIESRRWYSGIFHDPGGRCLLRIGTACQPTERTMADGPTLLKFPAPEVMTARDALQKALDDPEPLTNVIILSQREDGRIYHLESDGMTLKDVLWIVEGYKQWFMETVKK